MMKKSLVALAALAVAGLASAQSSVTLFGVVDAGVSYYDTKTTLANGASVKQSQWAQSSSGYNSSRLGFKGTEDLGGGLAASFWLEAGLSNDTGNAGGANGQLFNRRSTVSLSGPFGEVRIGRDYTPTFWNDTVFDPFGTNGVGTTVLYSQHAVLGDGNYVRSSNTVGYFLPSNLGGFYGQVQYGLPETVKTSGLTQDKTGRYLGGRFGYANGPLDVALAYGQSNITPAATLQGVAQDKVKTTNFGASYDFGIVKPFVQISQVKADVDFVSAFTASTSAKYNGYLIGLTAPVGPGLIRASFSTESQKIAGPDPKANKFALGYVHNLSKRTALYATIAHVSNKNGEALASNQGTVPAAPVAAFGAGTPGSSNGYDFGIRHSF